mgnify:CR=1 FL=1
MLREHIDAMISEYPDFSHCMIQTFCDDKEHKDDADKKHLTWMYSQDEPGIWEKLEKLNDEWAWIYFSVNSMPKWIRKKWEETRFNAWICDIDYWTKEQQMNLIKLFAIHPSLIVESWHWYHLYWFCKNWTRENWSKICWWLCNFFNWDPKIPQDTARVLRIPWFKHMKNPNAPFSVEIIGWSSKAYTEEQMLSVLTDFRTTSDRQEQARKFKVDAQKDWDWFWAKANALDCEYMLEELSWTKFVWWDSISFKSNWWNEKQIYVNWRSTSCWIDAQWKIGSYDKWWPNRTDWIAWYGNVNWKDVYSWVLSKHPELWEVKEKKEKPKPKPEVVEDSNTIDLKHITPFTWWVPSLDKKFWKFDYHSFVIAMWESGSWKTEYTFFQARQNALQWYKTCYIWLEMNKSSMINRIAMKRAHVSKEQWDAKIFTDSQISLMKQVREELWNWENLDIVSLKSPTVEVICDYIRERYDEWYKLFYIDNLWFVVWDDWETELDITKKSSRELKALTNELDVAIVLLHHYNKWWSVDRNRPRELSAIRSSWKIENDADMIFQVWRDLTEEDQYYKRKVDILLQKDRVRWDPSSVSIKFSAWDYEEREESF